ncbi:hypothetical protein D3C76_756620 [compost metagenome]
MRAGGLLRRLRLALFRGDEGLGPAVDGRLTTGTVRQHGVRLGGDLGALFSRPIQRLHILTGLQRGLGHGQNPGLLLVGGFGGAPASLDTGISGGGERLLHLARLRGFGPESSHVRRGAAECRGSAGNGAPHGGHLLRQLCLLGVERLQFLHDLPGVTLQAAQGSLPGATGSPS